MRSKYMLMLLVALGIAIGGATAYTQSSSPQPDRVEEDWQLVIANPDLALNGPQITTCMNPGPDSSTPIVLFNINYQDYPNFQPGGLQVKVWSDGQALTSSSQGTAQCATANETVTWTQRMSLSGGNTSYQVVSGQSTTWGQFGQGDNLAVTFGSTVSSLSDYNPDNSVARSSVSFEANRVTSMSLVQVRYYQGSTLLSTDSTPRSVALVK